ncbi:MAG: ATP-binding protein [bacterium]
MKSKFLNWIIVISSIYVWLLFSTRCYSQSKELREKDFSYRLQRLTAPRPLDRSRSQYLFVDLNQDGVDEHAQYVNSGRAYSYSPSKLIISDWSQTSVINDQENIDGKFIGIGCFDVYGSPYKEVIFFELLDEKIFLNVLNVENYIPERVVRLPLPKLPIPRNVQETTFAVYPVDVLDWDGDGSLDLLLVLYTTYGYQPRGVWIINIFTGKILLRKQIGPLVNNVITHDVDNDGALEILFGGNAVFNCEGWPEAERFYNGTDDSKSWVFIVDHNGEFLTKIPTGGIGSVTDIFVKDLNHDGTSEIIVTHAKQSRKDNSFVAFLDLASNQFIKRRQRHERIQRQVEFLDWQEDGKMEFLVLWNDGLLEIRDDKNNVVHSIDTELTNPGGLTVFDYEQDGVDEIAFANAAGMLLLDNQLEVMTHHPLRVDKFDIVSRGLENKKCFHILSDNQSSIFELKRNIVPSVYLPPLALLTFAAGITITLFVFGVVSSKTKYAILLNLEFSSNLICFLLDARGRIVRMGKNASRLLPVALPDKRNVNFQRLFASKGWKPVKQLTAQTLHQKTEAHNQEVVITSRAQQRYFMVNLISVKAGLFSRRYWLLTLQETTELVQSKQALAWASLAQRMAHEIKTPLSTVMLAAQQLQMKLEPNVQTKNQAAKYINHIIEQVNRLRRTTDVFMKFAHIQQLKLQSANIDQIVKQCLNELSGIISKNIKVHTEFESELPAIFLDQEQMSIAIKNLLENAINAMGDKGVLTVTTRLEQILQRDVIEKDAIALEISDTGCGIPADQLTQIFEPFFTLSRGGTGLGLTLVKKIVQDHRGDIRFKSEVGIGTTVTVTLPLKFEE